MRMFAFISQNMPVLLLIMVFIIIVIANIEVVMPTDKSKSCLTDSDCACGRNKLTGECFYGNKEFTNASRQCPDFCEGIGRNMEIKCISGECAQVQKSRTECSRDSDCGVGGCSGQVCTTAERAPSIITTCEYLPEYGCLKQTGCGCISGKCGWKKTQEYLDCMKNLGK
jgi:eight-cysteine-cluster-containing protein